MDNVFIVGKARFSVVSQGVIRMEYSENSSFVDERTLFAERNYLPVDCKASSENDVFTVDTGKIRLTYKNDGNVFSADNLTAKITAGSVVTDWFYGKTNENNLKGTLVTLDGVDGDREVPEGLIAKDGWHVIDDSCRPVFVDDWIANRDKNHIVDVYLFAYGHDYKQALKDLATVSGKMTMPRKYAFGSWYSRWWGYNSNEFLGIVREYEENDFPLDILVMDMDWHYQDWTYQNGEPKATFGHGHANGNLGWTGYTWNRRFIPDPDELLNALAEKNIIVTLNDHPHDGIRDHEECYGDFMKLMGKNPEDGENLRFNAGDKEYMEAFFKSAHEPKENQGVSFWWLDWQQDYIYPTVPGMDNLKHLQWLNYLYYQHSKKDGKRGISFSRWGGFGDHKHPLYFSGDSVTTWNTLKFEIEMTVSAGNAGCFWWSHDIGGFFDPERNPELYVRWVQFGITSAALRLHVCGDEKIDRRPWTWGEPACSAMRKMFHLRSRLMPYIYSVAYNSYKNSVPLLKPLYFDYPECDEAYNHPSEYLLGDGIFSAPIFEAGEGDDFIAKRDVWFKEGTWYNFFTGKKYTGESSAVVECDLYSFPLFIKAGMPIPMQPYTQRMTTSKLEHLIVLIYQGDDGCRESFSLFEDDGISENYESGGGLITDIEYRRDRNVCTVTFSPSGTGYDGMPEKRELTLELAAVGSNVSIVKSTNEAVVYYDSESASSRINIKEYDPRETVVISYKAD